MLLRRAGLTASAELSCFVTAKQKIRGLNSSSVKGEQNDVRDFPQLVSFVPVFYCVFLCFMFYVFSVCRINKD